MTLTAKKVKLQDIQSLRALFLQEANFQIRYDARHTRGWADEYLLSTENLAVGYGSVKGQELEGRDTVFEFFVLPPFRKNADGLFRELLSASGAKYIEDVVPVFHFSESGCRTV
jgi:hypothetical protein